MEKKTAPLDQFPAGTRGIVRHMNGGSNLVSRMASHGLAIGSEVLVRQNYDHGPLIVVVRDTRVALGRGQASRVLVEGLGNGWKPADEQ